MIHHHMVTSLLAVALIAFVQFLGPTADASDDIEALNEEHASFAHRTLDFLDRMDTLFFDRAEELNGGLELQTKTMGTEYSDYDIKVTRGSVIEKGGRTINITKKPTRDFQKPNLWGRYYLIDAHPDSPLVGMLHAAFVIQFFPDGSSSIGGFLDVLQTAHKKEDLAFMKQALDEVYEKYGIDPEPHRKLSNEGHDEDDPLTMDSSRRRRTTMVGGSFYLAPLPSVNEESFSFITEAYETMLSSYLEVVERRKDDSYTDEDLAAQDAMRKNWLEDRFFADPFTSSVTPYEAWSLYSLPPDVKF